MPSCFVSIIEFIVSSNPPIICSLNLVITNFLINSVKVSENGSSKEAKSPPYNSILKSVAFKVREEISTP